MTTQELINQVHNKLSVQLPEPPAGGHWMLGVAIDSLGNVASRPSLPSPFEYLDYKKMPDPHPWLTNLRDHARMLNGEIELPHDIKLSGNARQRRRQIREEREYGSFVVRSDSAYGYHISRCQECLKAAKQRRAYQRQVA